MDVLNKMDRILVIRRKIEAVRRERKYRISAPASALLWDAEGAILARDQQRALHLIASAKRVLRAAE